MPQSGSKTRNPTKHRISARALFEILTDHFGGDEKEALRLMRALTPLVIHLPPMAVIEKLARERSILEALEKDCSEDSVRRLAVYHGVGMRAIGLIYFKNTGTRITDARAILLSRNTPGTNGNGSVHHEQVRRN